MSCRPVSSVRYFDYFWLVNKGDSLIRAFHALESLRVRTLPFCRTRRRRTTYRLVLETPWAFDDETDLKDVGHSYCRTFLREPPADASVWPLATQT